MSRLSLKQKEMLSNSGAGKARSEMAMPKPNASRDPTSDLCPYDLDVFMKKHGLSKDAAQVILHSNGPSRARCDYAAEAFLRFKHMREARTKPPATSIK